MAKKTLWEDNLTEFEEAVAKKIGRKAYVDQTFAPGHNLAELRAMLIREEAAEVDEALHTGTKADLAKELADLLYVTLGTAVAFGINLGPIFARVHASNMNKITNGTVNEHGKLKKPVDYVPPDLSDLV